MTTPFDDALARVAWSALVEPGGAVVEGLVQIARRRAFSLVATTATIDIIYIVGELRCAS